MSRTQRSNESRRSGSVEPARRCPRAASGRSSTARSLAGCASSVSSSRADAEQRLAHERLRLEALEQGASQRARPDSCASGSPAARRSAQRPSASSDARRSGWAWSCAALPELGGGVVARGFDELPLHDFATKDERHEALAARAQVSRRAVEPPVELGACGRPRREVRERVSRTPRTSCSALSLVDRAASHRPADASIGHLAELALEARALDEARRLVLA